MGLDLGLASYWLGIVYGFSLAAPPGPVNAVIASRSLASYSRGFLVGAGAMSADLVLMLLTYTFYTLIRGMPLYPFHAAGAFFMTYLAIGLLRRSRPGDPPRDGPRGGLVSHYILGFGMGIVNPYQILWWLSAGLSFMGIFGIPAVAGLFTSIAVWISTFPLAVRAGALKLGSVFETAVRIFSLVVLLAFAAIFAYEAVRSVAGIPGPGG